MVLELFENLRDVYANPKEVLKNNQINVNLI